MTGIAAEHAPADVNGTAMDDFEILSYLVADKHEY